MFLSCYNVKRFNPYRGSLLLELDQWFPHFFLKNSQQFPCNFKCLAAFSERLKIYHNHAISVPYSEKQAYKEQKYTVIYEV